MNLALKVMLFFGELFLAGGMFYLFQEIMGWIQPAFIVVHTSAYAIACLIWVALPCLALFGLILRHTRKDEPPTYTGGYF